MLGSKTEKKPTGKKEKEWNIFHVHIGLNDDAHYQNRTDDLVIVFLIIDQELLVTRSTTEPSGLRSC